MIGDRAFREAVRTITVSYPIPFLVGTMLGSGVVTLGLYAKAQLWPLALVGIVSTCSAIALAAYAVVQRPELLRSEKHTLQHRMLEIIEDGDLNPEARVILGQALTSTLDPLVAKQPDHRLGKSVETEREHDDE